MNMTTPTGRTFNTVIQGSASDAVMKALTFGRRYGTPMMGDAALEQRIVATWGRPPSRKSRARRRTQRRLRKLYALCYYGEKGSPQTSSGITLSRADAYRLTQVWPNCGGRFRLGPRYSDAAYHAVLHACCPDHCATAYMLGQLTSQIGASFNTVDAIREALTHSWPLARVIDACWEHHEVGSKSMKLAPFLRAWLSAL